MIKRILTIDDDPALLGVYKDIFIPKLSETQKGLAQLEAMFEGLEFEGVDEVDFEVVAANSGEEGVKAFLAANESNALIDVCVVDMRMPRGMDGLATAQEIRKIDQNANILIVTAFSDKTSEEIRESLKENVYFLRKPFDQSELYQIVYSLAQNSQNMRNLAQINAELDARVKEEMAKSRQKDIILMRQSKLVALSELMSNIAHHWRQPLNVLSLNLQCIQVHHMDGHLTEEVLNDLVKLNMEKIQYLSSVIDKFSNLFQKNEESVVFKADVVLNEAIDTIRPSVEKLGIKIDCNIESSNVNIFGTKSEFLQAILNVVNNARDAITNNNKKDGAITIKLSIIDDNAKISIQNNGGNIDNKIIDSIFEPYFTTKHKAQDVGLGLFVSRTVIEQDMNGVLSVENTDDGVKFVATIPLAKQN